MTSKRIKVFFHYGECGAELLEDMKPRDFARFEVG